MSYRLILRGCLLGGAIFGSACSTSERAPETSYFGQPEPGLQAARFAPGVVSTDAIELNGVFTPDLREFFFTRLTDGVDIMHRSVWNASEWSPPQPLLVFPGQAHSVAVDMAISPDGQELYFLGQHPHEYAPENPPYDLWVSRRVDGGWATANVVPPPISTPADELYPTVVADGSLYFSSTRPGGRGRNNLYRAQRLADGSFADPVLLDTPINSEHGIGDAYVAPDESFMIFSSRRPPSMGHGDLFVSFRQGDGTWGDPIHTGDTINTDEHEYCPMMTPDGRFLFFSRLYGGTWEDATGGDVFWVDARVLDQFRR
jgi:hypothetical protein